MFLSFCPAKDGNGAWPIISELKIPARDFHRGQGPPCLLAVNDPWGGDSFTIPGSTYVPWFVLYLKKCIIAAGGRNCRSCWQSCPIDLFFHPLRATLTTRWIIVFHARPALFCTIFWFRFWSALNLCLGNFTCTRYDNYFPLTRGDEARVWEIEIPMEFWNMYFFTMYIHTQFITWYTFLLRFTWHVHLSDNFEIWIFAT